MTARTRVPARILIIIGCVIALVVVGALASVTVASVRLSGCSSCHEKDVRFAKATAATAHAKADVTCADCHAQRSNVTQRVKFGVYEAFGMWIPVLKPSATDATQPRDQLCLTCHSDVMEKTITTGGIRIAHAACSEGRQCVDCHSEVGHGSATKWPKSPAMNDCASCHKARRVSTTCETCHAGRVETDASKEPEFLATHGANWQKTHGMGQMTSCSLCHKEADCGSCHGPGVPHGDDFMNTHAATSQQPGATCLTCHNDAFCNSCHLIEMPHPSAFIAGHSDIVKKDGDTSCMRCHVQSDCDTCHEKHVHPGGAVGNIPKPDRGGN